MPSCVGISFHFPSPFQSCSSYLLLSTADIHGESRLGLPATRPWPWSWSWSRALSRTRRLLHMWTTRSHCPVSLFNVRSASAVANQSLGFALLLVVPVAHRTTTHAATAMSTSMPSSAIHRRLDKVTTSFPPVEVLDVAALPALPADNMIHRVKPIFVP